ncbi:MAG: biotin--[acetyl-CoA-carboxylase] ligase [Betaproteobacteria bacterium]
MLVSAIRLDSPRATPVSAGQRAAFIQPLRPDAIASALGCPGAAVEAVQETDSTNTDLLNAARGGAPGAGEVWLRCTLSQRAGRGRIGRRWFATPGSALLFSLALPLLRPQPPLGLTLAVGVALAEELTALANLAGGVVSDNALQLKWPNDILLVRGAQRAKLGGVLAELGVDPAGRRAIVVGVGINLWIDEATRGSIQQPAAALAELLPLQPIAREREYWLGRLAAAVIGAVRATELDGFMPQQARFMTRFADLNRSIDVREQGTRVAQGRALGVDAEGRLLVDVDGKVVQFASGETSVRPASGGRA